MVKITETFSFTEHKQPPCYEGRVIISKVALCQCKTKEDMKELIDFAVEDMRKVLYKKILGAEK